MDNNLTEQEQRRIKQREYSRKWREKNREKYLKLQGKYTTDYRKRTAETLRAISTLKDEQYGLLRTLYNLLTGKA
jgi:hypothetical protein